jgi:hypothetical protein
MHNARSLIANAGIIADDTPLILMCSAHAVAEEDGVVCRSDRDRRSLDRSTRLECADVRTKQAR